MHIPEGKGLMSLPRIMMFDEPSLGFAPILVKEIFEMILNIKEEGITILLAEQSDALGIFSQDGQACPIPLLLVAGFHFKKDFTSRENSWQKTFERNSITVSVVDHGIGEIDAVTKIFCDHITDALNVTPL